MLSMFIKKSDFAPLEVLEKPIIISQLADDTTIFMKHRTEVPKMLQPINIFSKAKCEWMAIHNSNSTEA